MKLFFSHIKFAIVGIVAINLAAPTVLAQAAAAAESSGFGLAFLLIVIVAIGGVGFLVWRRSKAAEAAKTPGPEAYNYYNGENDYDYGVESLDFDKELALLQKVKKQKPPKAAPIPVEAPKPEVRAYGRATGIVDIDTRAFQEKMRKLQYAQLPINSFMKLRPARLYDPLPYSEDPALLSAIEQAGEEYEEDEAVRELAVKILAAFRTRNSIDALAQIALYDLSSALRSKAVSILTDFDHPSVFESILLACADPTREVRAAAARGLFKLSFDRGDAWKRIAETNDEYRMRLAARAAVESGIATKSFERLVHEDLKIAQEAFALVSFMISADETNEIFDAVKSHRDERVRFALLHVLKVQRDERTAKNMVELSRVTTLSPDVAERVKETLANFPLAQIA